MHLDLGMTAIRLEGYALPAGVTLQGLACLLNDSRQSLLQIGVGLAGVLLMIVGIDHVAG